MDASRREQKKQRRTNTQTQQGGLEPQEKRGDVVLS